MAPPWGRKPKTEWQRTLPVVALVAVIVAYLVVPTWIMISVFILLPIAVFGIAAALAKQD